MDRVRIGFIGAGHHANSVHYPSLAELESAHLEAICDLDEERLNQTADKYAVPHRFRDHRQMLEQADLDAVYICLPPMGLRELAADCFQAGKPVFMEKPPGVSSEDCLAMLEAARANDCHSMVAFNRRFSAVITEAKRLVDEQGPPVQAMAEFHKKMVGQKAYYGLSILTCDVIHVVDCLRFFLGDAVEVESDVRQYNNDWDNVFNALIRFQGGAVGLLSACRVAGGRYERFELHGEGISAYIRAPEEAEVWTSDQDCRRLDGSQLCGRDDFQATYGFLGENRHFLECLQQDRTPLTNLADALESIRLCEWIQYGKPLA
ncbi:MAG: Gfo/Idh/MocA family protein [Armatimonadota bacterium]